MGRKEETRQICTAFKDWVRDTPLRIRGWVIFFITFIGSSITLSVWISRCSQPLIVWPAFVLVVISVIVLSFIPYYKRIKSKSVKITFREAYQPNRPPSKNGYISIDIEFNVKTSALPMKIAKIQMWAVDKILESNSPVLPIDQTAELESYVASFDLDYYLYFNYIISESKGKCWLWVLGGGSKWTSREFGLDILGDPSTLLMRNKPDDFNLIIKK
jgi:hypothetical protein